MKQKKIAIIMAGILAAAAAMTGCAEQNKTETQVDYTQNSQEKSEQTKQKTAEKSQPDKKQVNKSTSIGKEDSNQTADKKAMIYDSEGNGRLISEADDGNWYDSDGNYYGSWEDIEDAMVNENGVTDQDGNKYYWTAPHDASEEVTDPYDLYSWDPGTNSYIPFQAAESDCSPVGRGNGWYYYDEDSGEYVPW